MIGNPELMLGLQWSPAATAAGWLVMLVAMMPPLLLEPVGHVWYSSQQRRRIRALLLFGLAYTAVWFTLAFILLPAAILLRLAASDAAPLAAIALAVAWSASPPAQSARNRCHRLPAITPFGRAADRDCLRQGVASGLACAATCWPWMLVPMTFDGFHVAAMAAAGIVLFAERVAPPQRAAWQLPPFLSVLVSLRPPQKVLGRP